MYQKLRQFTDQYTHLAICILQIIFNFDTKTTLEIQILLGFAPDSTRAANGARLHRLVEYGEEIPFPISPPPRFSNL